MVDNTLEEWIASRGISVEDAAAAMLGETDTPQTDVHPSMEYLDGVRGVVIPYFNADGSPLIVDEIPFARMRRLGVVPRDPKTGKSVAKYVQGSGTGVHVYLCPFVDWVEVFRNTKIPIVITEGEAKAIALCSKGIACIALGGVSSIRNKKTKEFLPEAASCDWAGRVVYICFDSDAQDNPDVYSAQEALRYELSVKRDADVRVVVLPSKPGGVDEDGKPLPAEKVGIDDFLLWQGLGEFQKLLHSAPSVSKLDKEVLALNNAVCFINDEGVLYEFATDKFMPRDVFTGSPQYGSIKLAQVAMTKKGPVDRPPISVAKEWLTHPNARYYGSTVFKPGEPEEYYLPGAGRVLNRWKGFRAAPGNVEPFLKLTDFIFSEVEAHNREFAIKLLAYKAQNPGEKIPIAIFLVGTKGSGKSMWCEIIQKAFAPASTMLQPSILTGDYNSFVDRTVLVFIDEVTPRVMDQAGETLKLLISQPQVMLNEKYRPMKPVDNLGLYVLTSNYPEAASFSRDERRYFVVRCPDKIEDDTAREFYDELIAYKNSNCGPAVMDYLLNYDLQGWKPPLEAPMTSERDNAYREGLNPITSLAEQILTADGHIVAMWVENSLRWAKETKANMPTNPPASLIKKLQAVEAQMPHWPIRPFYSMSEIALLFPALSEQLMGNKAGRYKNYTPEQISSQLRTAGVKTLRNAEQGSFGFVQHGVREPYLIIADTKNPEWKKPLTQREFEDLLQSFGTYAELKGTPRA